MPRIYPKTIQYLTGIKLICVNGGKFVEVIKFNRFVCHCDNNPEVIHNVLKDLKVE